MPAIDFSEVQSLEPVPAGTYVAEVTFAQPGVSQSGQEKIDIRYQVTLEATGEQRLVFDTMSFHPKALWRTKQSLQALGFAKDFSGEVDCAELIGRQVRITVAVDTGRTNPETGEEYPDRNRIVKIQPVVPITA